MSTALSSWKEIAAYLGKGVRTVQRWEQQFALPVRRPSAKSHIIFAIPAELDAWVKHQHSRGTLTSLVTVQKQRMEQDRLVKLLEDKVHHLQEQRRQLDLHLTRLTARIRDIAQNGASKKNSNSQESAKRDAA